MRKFVAWIIAFAVLPLALIVACNDSGITDTQTAIEGPGIVFLWDFEPVTDVTADCESIYVDADSAQEFPSPLGYPQSSKSFRLELWNNTTEQRLERWLYTEGTGFVEIANGFAHIHAAVAHDYGDAPLDASIRFWYSMIDEATQDSFLAYGGRYDFSFPTDCPTGGGGGSGKGGGPPPQG